MRKIAIVGVGCVVNVLKGQLMSWQDATGMTIDADHFGGVGNDVIDHKGRSRHVCRSTITEANARVFGPDAKYLPPRDGAVAGINALAADYDIYLIAPPELPGGINVCDFALLTLIVSCELSISNIDIDYDLRRANTLRRMHAADLVIDTDLILLQRAAEKASGRLIQIMPEAGEPATSGASPPGIERVVGWEGVGRCFAPVIKAQAA